MTRKTKTYSEALKQKILEKIIAGKRAGKKNFIQEAISNTGIPRTTAVEWHLKAKQVSYRKKTNGGSMQGKKHDAALREQVVEELQQRKAQGDHRYIVNVAKKFNLPIGTITWWLRNPLNPSQNNTSPKTYSFEERQKWVAAWEKQGGPVERFARANGLPKSSFHKWIKTYGAGPDKTGASSRVYTIRTETQWRKLVAEQAASGDDARTFCRKNKISLGFFYKKRKDLGLDTEPPPAGKAVVVHAPPLVKPATFLPVAITKNSTDDEPSVTVVLLKGASAQQLVDSIKSLFEGGG